jgi:hypothetical protein
MVESRIADDEKVKQKNSDQLFTNLFDLLSFDLPAIVIFQRQVDSYFFGKELPNHRHCPTGVNPRILRNEGSGFHN